MIRFREVILTYTTLEGSPGKQQGTTPRNDGLSQSGTMFGQAAGILPPTNVGMMQPILTPGGPSSSVQFGRIAGVS